MQIKLNQQYVLSLLLLFVGIGLSILASAQAGNDAMIAVAVVVTGVVLIWLPITQRRNMPRHYLIMTASVFVYGISGCIFLSATTAQATFGALALATLSCISFTLTTLDVRNPNIVANFIRRQLRR